MQVLRETILGTPLALWYSGQTSLERIIRFKKYPLADPRLRVQHTLAHTHSLTTLAIIFLSKLHPYITLDEAFLLKAVTLHDVGEGLTGRDVLFIDKHASKDLEEYIAFMKACEGLDPCSMAEFQEAFLLQFARTNPACFPDDARTVMRKIIAENENEALAFEALERFDYLFYPLECFVHHGNVEVLTHVLRNQIPALDHYASLLPGLREEVWTDEVRDWCMGFVHAHPEVPAETRK